MTNKKYSLIAKFYDHNGEWHEVIQKSSDNAQELRKYNTIKWRQSLNKKYNPKGQVVVTLHANYGTITE